MFIQVKPALLLFAYLRHCERSFWRGMGYWDELRPYLFPRLCEVQQFVSCFPDPDQPERPLDVKRLESTFGPLLRTYTHLLISVPLHLSGRVLLLDDERQYIRKSLQGIEQILQETPEPPFPQLRASWEAIACAKGIIRERLPRTRMFDLADSVDTFRHPPHRTGIRLEMLKELLGYPELKAPE